MQDNIVTLIRFAIIGSGAGVSWYFFAADGDASLLVVASSVVSAFMAGLIWVIFSQVFSKPQSKIAYTIGCVLSACTFGNLMWVFGYSIFTFELVTATSETDQIALTIGCAFGAIIFALLGFKTTHARTRKKVSVPPSL